MKFLPAFHFSFGIAAIAALILTALPVPAQRVGGQWTLEGEWYGTWLKGFFGTAVAGPGDLNFDGYDDLLIGAPRETFNLGTVYAYSGRDRNLLWSWTDLGSCNSGQAVDGAGDLNGDGRPDVIVGIPECGKAASLLHDGTVWWTIRETGDFGVSVAGAGDVNLDGFDDVIVGYSEASPGGVMNAGSAFVYSGRDGTLLHRFDGQVTRDYLGQAVGAAGDVNADGWPDLIAGAPQANRGGFVYNGAVYVYSGRDGSLLHEFTGSAANEYLGDRVAGAGDLDGDGYDDLLLGAVGASRVGYLSGSVYVYSGRTGGLLYRLDGKQPEDRLGTALDSLEDVDLDGVRDIAVAALEDYYPTRGPGRVAVYSGATGALLDLIPGFLPISSYPCWGCSVADVGDADADGFPDLLIGAKTYSHPFGPYDAGAAFLYSFDPFLAADAITISATSGGPVQIEIAFPATESFQRYALLFSGTGTGPTTLGGIQVPLGAGPLLSAMLGGQAPPNVQGAYGTLDANAQAGATITNHPLHSTLVGRGFPMAAVSYDAATMTGRRTSIAWPITVIS